MLCTISTLEDSYFSHLPHYFPSYKRIIHWWLRDSKESLSTPSAILMLALSLEQLCRTFPNLTLPIYRKNIPFYHYVSWLRYFKSMHSNSNPQTASLSCALVRSTHDEAWYQLDINVTRRIYDAYEKRGLFIIQHFSARVPNNI